MLMIFDPIPIKSLKNGVLAVGCEYGVNDLIALGSNLILITFHTSYES